MITELKIWKFVKSWLFEIKNMVVYFVESRF